MQTASMPDLIVEGDCTTVLPTLPDADFQLIYIDPPFNTGSERRHTTMRMTGDPEGTRTGFQGRRYRLTDVEGNVVKGLLA